MKIRIKAITPELLLEYGFVYNNYVYELDTFSALYKWYPDNNSLYIAADGIVIETNIKYMHQITFKIIELLSKSIMFYIYEYWEKYYEIKKLQS